MWLTCVVLSAYFFVRCILIRISVTPPDMGDGLITESKCSNATSLCLNYENYEDDNDYLVVEA
jgi:hypothetical protein